MAGPSEGARNRVAARAAAANGSSDAPQGNNSRSLVALLEDMRPHLERVAAHHLNPGRMLQLATTLLKTTPDLAKCTPFTFLGAVMQCAQVGLEPGVLGRAYIIPFFNRKKGVMEAQFIIGYRGIIFSDDLEMGGILKFFSIEEAVIEVLRAGGDLLEICHSAELILRGFEALLAEAERSAAFRALLLSRAAELERKRKRLYAAGVSRALTVRQYEALRQRVLRFRDRISAIEADASPRRTKVASPVEIA
jgi:hypothetical protein